MRLSFILNPFFFQKSLLVSFIKSQWTIFWTKTFFWWTYCIFFLERGPHRLEMAKRSNYSGFSWFSNYVFFQNYPRISSFKVSPDSFMFSKSCSKLHHACFNYLWVWGPLEVCSITPVIVSWASPVSESIEWRDWQTEGPTSGWGSLWDSSSFVPWFSTFVFRDVPGTVPECVRICWFKRNSSNLDRVPKMRDSVLLNSWDSFYWLCLQSPQKVVWYIPR